MTDDERRDVGPIEFGSERLEAFSDGVIAVVITILALELKPPGSFTFHALLQEWPSLLIYILTFTLIAIYWNNHHHLLRVTTRISAGVMWANMVLLFSLSLFPVETEWLRAFPKDPVPAASFGFVGLAAACSYYVLVRAILRANGRDSAVGVAISNDVKGKVSVVLHVAGIGLAFVNVWIAYAIYTAIAVMWLIPDRRIERGVTSSP